jgi:hypothetical protein
MGIRPAPRQLCDLASMSPIAAYGTLRVLTKTFLAICFLFLVCALLSACSPCYHEKESEMASPSHQLTATVVRVGCGAMAKDATWVTLYRTGEKNDPNG